MTTTPTACWCGSTDLVPFGPGYLRCATCETLVSAEIPGPEIAHVTDEERDFYGRQYWFSYQEEHLGNPPISVRARSDLPERCLHWLRALLAYKTPPARVLELGSAHGGFVAVLRFAGFEATGLEISPWVVEYARETFQVPVLLGPVEDQQIAPASFDVIALMDVLEHLREPARTMQRCLHLLKPDGILLIQTPRYVAGESYPDMLGQNREFLKILEPREHLYLFSQRSVSELFGRLGAPHIAFEPPLFPQYDMFLVVSRLPLARRAAAAPDGALTGGPGARLVQALIDKGDEVEKARQRHAEAEEDRARRLVLIQDLGRQVGEATAARSELEAEVVALRQQMELLEADWAARLTIIEEQGVRLGHLEADRNNLQAEAARLQKQVEGLEADLVEGQAMLDEEVRRRVASEAELAGTSRERDHLRLQAGAHAEQIKALVVQMRTLQEVVQAIVRTRAYRWLRRLGRWTFLDRALTQSPPDHGA
jgi:2-polyprenyl-3-methyl-5-hydroxy-6-metoxy-1,4-benzoquinol methylase